MCPVLEWGLFDPQWEKQNADWIFPWQLWQKPVTASLGCHKIIQVFKAFLIVLTRGGTRVWHGLLNTYPSQVGPIHNPWMSTLSNSIVQHTAAKPHADHSNSKWQKKMHLSQFVVRKLLKLYRFKLQRKALLLWNVSAFLSHKDSHCRCFNLLTELEIWLQHTRKENINRHAHTTWRENNSTAHATGWSGLTEECRSSCDPLWSHKITLSAVNGLVICRITHKL